jgi:SAM-dependent methyltransferase
MVLIINWDELWKLMRLSSPWRVRDVSFWDRRARRYNEFSMRRRELTEWQLSRMELRPDYTVLDVGAGTGRLAIPMARRVKRVTAVEPSEGMLECLKENAERERVENIVYVNKRWEDVELGIDVEPHDVVVASHSLFMLDVRGALEKVDAAAKKRAYIFTFAGGWDGELWRTIYGEEYRAWRPPDYIFIYNILYDMGIYANVEVREFEHEEHYVSLDEAVANFKEMYDVPPEREEALRGYLSKALVRDPSGLRLRRRVRTAMIWWRKGEGGGP